MSPILPGEEMNTRTIYDMYPGDLEDEVVGKTVTSVDTESNTITLSNGTVLGFEDNEDCCAWFSAELEAGNLTDNAVTAIKVTGDDPYEDSSSETDYTIHILAANTKIADVTITGSAGTGYYCHSIILNVKEKK